TFRPVGLATCFGASTVMLGSDLTEPVGVSDAAGPHSKTVDKTAKAEGAAKPDDNLMTCRPNPGRKRCPDKCTVLYIPSCRQPRVEKICGCLAIAEVRRLQGASSLAAVSPSFAPKPRSSKPFQSAYFNSVSTLKFYLLFFRKIILISAHSDSPEGALRIVTGGGSGCGGRASVVRRAAAARTAKGQPRDSQDVTASLTIQCEIATTRIIETRATEIAGPLVNARVSGGRVTVRA